MIEKKVQRDPPGLGLRCSPAARPCYTLSGPTPAYLLWGDVLHLLVDYYSSGALQIQSSNSLDWNMVLMVSTTLEIEDWKQIQRLWGHGRGRFSFPITFMLSIKSKRILDTGSLPIDLQLQLVSSPWIWCQTFGAKSMTFSDAIRYVPSYFNRGSVETTYWSSRIRTINVIVTTLKRMDSTSPYQRRDNFCRSTLIGIARIVTLYTWMRYFIHTAPIHTNFFSERH